MNGLQTTLLLDAMLYWFLLLALKLLLVTYLTEPGSVTFILCGQLFEKSATC